MKKGENDQKELTAIDICIKRSKEVAQEKKSLITLRSTKTEIMKCSKRFFSEDKLKDLENEIKNSIIEIEMSIALILKPILATQGIVLEHRYWISLKEISEGYILLRKSNSLCATHVLFLRDYKDSFDNTEIKQGEIKQYKHVNHFLERIDAFNELKKVQSKTK